MGHEADAAPGMSWAALDALVTEVVSTRRQIAALQAREAGLLADAVDLVTDRIAERRQSGRRIRDADLPLREVSAELGAAMRVSDRTVQRRMGDAVAIVMRFPATMQAWAAGTVDAGHVDAILDAGSAIDDEAVRARFEAQALDIASTESPQRLRAVAQAIAAQLDPASSAERLRRCEADRRVRVVDLGDGLSRLYADLPTTLARAIEDRLSQMARIVKDAPTVPGTAGGAHDTGAVPLADDRDRMRVITGTCYAAGADEDAAGEHRGDTDAGAETGRTGDVSTHRSPADLRTMDQLRADILADLLLSGAPAAHGAGDALGAITAHVQVTVPVLALAGVSDEPALLAGSGPIDIETARRLAASAPGWDRVMTNPYTGAILGVDRYRPSSELRRFLRARDEHCRFPGCLRSPLRCDIDHTIDAAFGGATDASNLAHFCRRHHTLKHATAWSVRQLGGGVLEWMSPTGRKHPDRPPSTVRFVPSEWMMRLVAYDDPPPF